MTASAWGFLLTAWSVILVATAYCFAKLLTSERRLDDEG